MAETPLERLVLYIDAADESERVVYYRHMTVVVSDRTSVFSNALQEIERTLSPVTRDRVRRWSVAIVSATAVVSVAR